MSARPWMPLNIPDYLADTAHLGALESGAYLHLIFHYWQTGGLPSEDKELGRIAKVSSHSWKKLCPAIQKFFYDGWKHKRIEIELAKACEISGKRSAAAKSRYENKPANAPANAEQKQTHLHLHKQEQKKEERKKDIPSLRSGEFMLVGEKLPIEQPVHGPPAGAVSRETNPDWPADAFEQFYSAYPRKIERPDAQKAFDRVRKKHRVPWVGFMAAVHRYAATADPQFTKYPATWLNKGGYTSQDAPHERSSQNRTTATARSRSGAQDTLVAGMAAALRERSDSRLGGCDAKGRSEGAKNGAGDLSEPRTIEGSVLSDRTTPAATSGGQGRNGHRLGDGEGDGTPTLFPRTGS